MAFGVTDENDKAVTLNTDHDLSTQTGSNIWVFNIDTGPMTNGSSTDAADELEITILTKCRSGGTERVAFRAYYTGAQSDAQKYSHPIPSNVSAKFRINQKAGVARTFPWKLYNLV